MEPSIASRTPVTMAQNSPILTAVPSDHVKHREKSEKFNCVHFKRWQKMFYLTTLNLARFLNKEALVVGEQDSQVFIALDTWKNSDFLCRNYVLNTLHNAFYNMHSVKKTAKELWESLEKKYKIEDVGSKKFVVCRFLDYKMVDSKTVINQVQEIQVIQHKIFAKQMILCEPFHVTCMIEKMSPGRKDINK